MVGSNGERMLSLTLPHVELWNTWYTDYGNSPEGFAQLNWRVTAAAERAGRPPVEIKRSACVLVSLEDGAVRRPVDDGVEAVTADRLRSHLRDLAEAGADEAIVVVRPITERSIRSLGESLVLVPDC
jgi:alkanesulfonate monooxygenase SsuD/methylene tetrahydromethanopterin reductase-like flavin-dependent oxidoreductase (luciferase family)